MLPLLIAISVFAETPYYQAPSGQEFAQVVPGGRTILPNGRFLAPGGKRLYTKDDLWYCGISPDGKTIVGIDDAGITVYGAQGGKPNFIAKRRNIAPAGAFSPSGGRFYASNGDNGGVDVYRTSDWTLERTIDVRGPGRAYPYLNDLALSRDGRTLYGVDVSHQDLVAIDVAKGEVIAREKAGRQPYAVELSPDGKTAYVANIGIFNYKVIPRPAEGQGNPRGLNRPAFPFPSKESEEGIQAEGRNVPGLGSPYVPDAHSVWTYAISEGKPKLARQVKTGLMIHAPTPNGKAVGGSAPCAVHAVGPWLFVSNSNNDTVQQFEAKTMRLRRTIRLAPAPGLAQYRGVIPNDIASDPARGRLYVCEGGINAVAVIDIASGRVLGHIPTGWFPLKAALSPDRKSLAIATQKGLGRGPRGPQHARPAGDERFGLPDMPGMIDYRPVPADSELRGLTQSVLAMNGMVPATRPRAPKVFPMTPGRPSPNIEYVVFITKENHTFDGIFGGLKGAKGWPEYAEFGMNGWIAEKGKAERLPIMPNHIRLAEQFAINENFYMEPQASGDGHRWLVGVYPSYWTTRVFYAGWNFRPDDNTPGRMVSFGSDGSQIPEDYLENGSMFDYLHAKKIPFRNYGEGYELPQTDEGEKTSKTGTFYPYNHPMDKVLYDNTCFDFPAYNTNIPDIARADWFIEDLQKNYIGQGRPLPRFLNIAICNDHGASPRPNWGYPFVASYMADNDVALGRIVEWLSHRPEWKKMAIFVTQDDPGGDNDHIDRHRSFVLAISPYVKRGHISRDHTSIMSIVRSIYMLFGLGPNNMFDAVATPLHDMFTDKPDFTPYKHVAADPRVFKPEDTFDPSDPNFERRRRERPAVKMDDPKFIDWLRSNKPKRDKD